MARTMTDEQALAHMPAVWELVKLVAERDEAGVEAALAHTPPATLAVLAAGLVQELVISSRRADHELEALQAAAADQSVKDAAVIADLVKARTAQADMIASLKQRVRELGGRPR